MYLSFRNRKIDLIGKLKGLYVSFWKVFFVFIPIAFLFFRNQPIYCANETICTKYSIFSWNEFLGNLTGIHLSYNGEWWFLISYAYAIITFPLIRHFADKYSAKINIAIVVIFSILVTNVFPAVGKIEIIGTLNKNYLYRSFFCQSAPYISSFWMGAVVAKDDLLKRLKESLKDNHLLNPVFDIFAWLIIIYLYRTGPGNTLDIFYIPFLILTAIDLLNYFPVIRKLFLQFGKQSTNMWLIHTFFCYYFYPFARLVTAPRWAIPSLMILIVFSYIASLIVMYFWQLAAVICRKILPSVLSIG